MTCQSAIVASPKLRMSLKRGLAREAVRHARASDANLSIVFDELKRLRPNPKAQARSVRRLLRIPGVMRVSSASSHAGVVLSTRNIREILTRSEGVDLYQEVGLVYTRIAAESGRRSVSFAIERVAFCTHALERMVERTACGLSRILEIVDFEAIRALRQLSRDQVIEHDSDCYLATKSGVWAGSVDATEAEPDWGIVSVESGRPMPVFSVRTFLGEAEMRPMVWHRWQNASAIQ